MGSYFWNSVHSRARWWAFTLIKGQKPGNTFQSFLYLLPECKQADPYSQPRDSKILPWRNWILLELRSIDTNVWGTLQGSPFVHNPTTTPRAAQLLSASLLNTSDSQGSPAVTSGIQEGTLQEDMQAFHTQVLIKSLLASHLLMSHWPEQVMWPSPESVQEGNTQGREYLKMWFIGDHY